MYADEVTEETLEPIKVRLEVPPVLNDPDAPDPLLWLGIQRVSNETYWFKGIDVDSFATTVGVELAKVLIGISRFSKQDIEEARAGFCRTLDVFFDAWRRDLLEDSNDRKDASSDNQ
jgi:hypothetical protein